VPTASDTSVISDKGRVEITGANVNRLDYYNAVVGTADIVIKLLQSIQNTSAHLVSEAGLRSPYHYFSQPPLASRVAENRFQDHNPASIFI